MTVPIRATPHSTASNVPTPATSAATSKASDNTGISQVQRGMIRFEVYDLGFDNVRSA